MKRINSLVRKLASIAPKAASLAIVVAGVFATSPMAFAQQYSCNFDWGGATVYEYPGPFSFTGQLYVGGLNGQTSGNFNVEYQQSGDLTIQSLGVESGYTFNKWPAQGTQGLVTLYPNNQVTFAGTVPSTATNGQSVQVTFTVGGTGQNIMCSYPLTVVVQNPCGQKVTEWNGTPLTATLVSENSSLCEIESVPTGATGPFIYNNSYYVVAKPTTCLPGAGTWDGANCYYMEQPEGGTLWQNSFFVPSRYLPDLGDAHYCSLGTYDASTNNCLVKTAPWGTQAFVSTIGNRVMWYFTPLMTCPVAGAWDGAHCYIMTAPTGTKAILLNNTFYYQ
jgi:hypothetical protein